MVICEHACVCLLQVPVLAMSHKLEASYMKDIRMRSHLGSDALPSAVFFTFLNTDKSLNCIAFAADGALLAGASSFFLQYA